MGIEKVALQAAKTATKVSARKAATSAVTTKLLPEFKKTTDVISKLPKDAYAHNYSAETIEAIEKSRKNLYEQIKSQLGTGEKAGKMYEDYNNFITEILTCSKSEKIAKYILSSHKNICKYSTNKSEVCKAFKNMYWTSSKDVKGFLYLMSVYRMLSPKLYQELLSSKAIQEIAHGKLNPALVIKEKTQDVMKDNFVDKLFENITKASQDKLKAKGIDTKFITEYINLAKDDIKRDPQRLEKLLKTVEDVENPELINTLLSNIPAKDYIDCQRLGVSILEEVLNAPKEIVEKVLKLKKMNPFMMRQYIEMFENKSGKLSITDDLFEYFLKLEEANPQAFTPWCLKNFNNLLYYTNGDVAFAKAALENLYKQKNGAGIFMDLSESISSHNIDYVKQIIPKDWQISKEIQTKIYLSNNEMFKDPKNWSKMDELYEQTFTPLLNILKEMPEAEYHAARLTKLKIDNPELYKYIEDNHVIDLISQGKVNPRILNSFGYPKLTKFRSEVIEDLGKLSRGESLVKHFDSLKDIVKKTKSGDVVSVNGKMYVNNNGRLEPWNMTEEKFNELFPLVDRFTTHQANDDCYFIASLNALYENPKTRGAYYKLFEQKGDEIFVTIPAYQEYGGVIKFPKSEISTDVKYGYTANGAKHIQMLEQAYSRSAFREGEKISISQNPQATTDLKFLNERIRGGFNIDVMREFQPAINYPATSGSIYISDKNKGNIRQLLETYVNNPRYIVSEGFKADSCGITRHARHIRSYNPQTHMVNVVDPRFSEIEREIPVEEFSDKLIGLFITRVG